MKTGKASGKSIILVLCMVCYEVQYIYSLAINQIIALSDRV